jgi:hypothetical protein
VPGHGPAWPVRSGAIPPFADGFTPRLETVPDVDAALEPGVTVALVPAGPRDWLASAGKTQVAVSCAETLWQARTIDLLIWVNASSRASALSGFLRGAAAVGANPHADADAESTVAQLISWLATTTRPWLVVLDDVCAAADLEGLWPDGPAGRLIVTTSDIGTIPRDRHAVALRVPLYSAREATAFIAGRLTTNPDQRNGTIDLVYDLGSEPMALGHACAVIASSGLSCRDYREYYTEWKAGLAPAGGPAVAVTWALSAAYAEKLMPGSREVLTVSAFLDGHAIPGSVFTTLAVSKFLARESAFQSPDPEHTWNCVRALNQTGLLSIDATSTLPTVRVAQPVQEAVRAQLSAELSEHALRTVADTRGLRAGARARECRYHHGRHQAGRRTAGGGPGRGGGHLVPVGIRGADHLDTLAARDEYAAACVAAGNLAMAVDTYRLSLADRSRLRRPSPTR